MIHPARAFLLSVAAILPIAASLAEAGEQPRKNEVLLSFSGVLKTLTRRELVIEPDPDNQMAFLRSKRTKFFDAAGKEVAAEAVRPGGAVTIQSATKLNGDLEAVVVTAIDPDRSPKQ